MTTPDDVAMARTKMLEAMGNIPSTGDGPGGNSISDRTGNAATAPPDHDIAKRDWQRLDQLLTSCASRASRRLPTAHVEDAIAQLVKRWQPLDAKQRDSIAAGAPQGDDGCTSCARVPDSQGRPTYSTPMDRMTVCQQCYRDLRRVRARYKHRDAEHVPPPVIRWRRSRSDRRLTDDILDDLLSGKLVVP